MHFIVTGPEYYGYSESIIGALQKIDCDVDFFPVKEFYANCPYWKRKLYKMGLKSLQMRWDNQWESDFRKFISEHCQKETIFLFLTGAMISTELLRDLYAHKKILYMWDSIRRYSDDFQRRLHLFDYAFAFEYSDIDYAREKLCVQMKYMPLGYDDTFYYPMPNIVRDIDVSFVGSPIPSRLNLLESVAEYCTAHGLRLYTGGRWHDEKWHKKRSFRKKRPFLSQFHDNRSLTQAETAAIYRRSKICLNINNEVHKSISPRTLEIMATQSFQIMNEGQNFSVLGNDREIEKCVDTYHAIDDLLEKIQFYLDNERLRFEKAVDGYRKISPQYSEAEIMKRIMHEIGR